MSLTSCRGCRALGGQSAAKRKASSLHPQLSWKAALRSHLHNLPWKVQHTAGSSSQEAPQPRGRPISNGHGPRSTLLQVQTSLLSASHALPGLQLPLLLVEAEPDQPLLLDRRGTEGWRVLQQQLPEPGPLPNASRRQALLNLQFPGHILGSPCQQTECYLPFLPG